MMSPRLLVLRSAVCFGATGTAAALRPSGQEPFVVTAMRILIGGALLTVGQSTALRRGQPQEA